MGCQQRGGSLLIWTIAVLFVVALQISKQVTGRKTGFSLNSFTDPPVPPTFPSTFEVAYNFSLPYEKTVQKDGLVYPVVFWRDAERGVSRMDTFGGRNILISTKDKEIEIMPRLQKLICRINKPDADDEPLVDAPVLPDVSNWHYNGTLELRGQQAHLWVYEKSHGAKVTLYKFYVAEDGAPMRLHMDGNDMFSGAHFDEYIADYEYLKAGPVDVTVFEPPPICDGQRAQSTAHPPAFPLRMAALLPSVRIEGGDELYDEFAAAHGRRHASAAEYKHRRGVFHSNRLYVEAHNSAGRNYSLALNRYADWSQEEFEAVMLPRHGAARGLVARRHGEASGELPYERLAPAWRLPRGVDWRGTGADGIVKDQATCGSCWAFGATAALQGAYWAATGKTASFSEQQLMDCSWKFGANHACDGGDFDNAIDYLVNVGGIAKEEDYEYLGQDDFCGNPFMADTKEPSSSLFKVKGYAYVPPHDDEALMEAVYSRGTVAVSLDASQPAFRFYASGTFDEPGCMWKSDDLDHAVALVGYGTDEAGVDYWLIKNSWSSHWGDSGYIKIARGHHGCGITTDPVYAVFDGKHRFELPQDEAAPSA